MSLQQKVWDYLRVNNPTTKEIIINTLALDKKAVTTYISALNSSNYLIFCSTSKRAGRKDYFKLVKDFGDKAPLLNKGILKDFNIKEEIKIAKEIKRNDNFNCQKNLKYTLESFLELNKEEVLLRDISKIFVSKRKLNTKSGNTFLARWIKKLESNNTITFTNNTYRNSRIYLVDLEKTKYLLENINKFEDYNLLF